MKATTRPRIARIYPKSQILADKLRRPVVELDTAKSTVALRLEGCSSRNIFAVEDLARITSSGGSFSITTAATSVHKGEKLPLVLTIDIATGEVTVSLLGRRKGRKRYDITDLFRWGAQLKLL